MQTHYRYFIVYLFILLATACTTSPPRQTIDPLEGSWVLIEGDLNYKGIAGFVIEKSDDDYFITLGEHRQQGFVAQGERRSLLQQSDIYLVSDPDLFHMEIKVIDTGLEVRIRASDNSERLYRYQRQIPRAVA